MPAESKCPYCGSTDIVRDVTLRSAGVAGDIGLQHRQALVFVVTEALYADLCKACGSITRFHVKETDRKWVTG